MSLLSVAPDVPAAPAPASPPAAAQSPLQNLPYTPSLDVTAMDRSANACADFYQYSCGGWLARNPIPADQASWSVYGKLYQDNQRFLWGILDSLARNSAGRSANQQKIGDYFASCMDETAIEQRGRTPLAPTLAAIDAMTSARELPALLARLQLDNGGDEFLFGFTSAQDFADSKAVIAFANAGGLGMPDRDYYTDSDKRALTLRQEYRRHVARSFALLGDSAAAAAQHADTVLRLETQLAQASLTRVELRDPYNLFHKMDRAGLEHLTPHFVWDPFLNALGLSGVNTLNVSQPKFYAALDQLLASTTLDDLKTYLRWHAVHAASPFLARRFEAERFAFFDHTLRGVPQQQPRWKRCVRQVDALLGEALGQEFVARTFGPKLKGATLLMTRQIEQAMHDDIEALPWMSAATKQQALAKLAAVVNKIGYPDRWRDYGSVAIARGDYFQNAVHAIAFESHRQLNKIGKPLDRAEWQMTPQTVNAYYDPQMNDINFPAGVLQPPLYDPRMDDAPNYGNTGGTIGHELTHGFDDQGRKFDAAGNLKDWWSDKDAKQFNERTQCIVDQYAKYVVVDDVHINSRLTLGEDVADLGGLILAHMAWRVQTAHETLTGRDGLTPEQRFFVGYAQWACENQRPENLRLHAKTDEHSPGRYRVNGLVVNMPEFAKAFSCPVNAPLAKKNPCRVW
ncbi:MAG TPA: M13 family metallopeptidase [Steroidobacteraceae bacterium]